MPEGQIGEELRALRASRGNRPQNMTFGPQMPEGMDNPENFDPEVWDRIVESIPEMAGLMSQMIPQAALPKALLNIARLGFPAAGEMFRQLSKGEEFSIPKLAARTGMNAAPMIAGKGMTPAAKAYGGSLTKQALGRGVQAAQTSVDDLASGGTGLAPGANVSQMAGAATREGASLGVQDARKFAQYAKELKALQGRRLNSTAQAAYLRARPEVNAALQRAGGDVNGAIKEFEGLASVLTRTREGAARQGFNWPRFLAGAGVGGMVDYATGLPGLGTATGTALGAMEGSIPLKFNIGQRLAHTPEALGPTVEAATRGGMAAGTAAMATGPKKRRLKEE